MASAIFTTSQSGPGVQGTLTNNNDGAYVAAGVVVGSTDSNGIEGSANYHYVTIAGTLIGTKYGIVLGNVSASNIANAGERVVVRAGAEVYGYQLSGVKILAVGSSVRNDEYIYGDDSGVRIDGGYIGSTSTITNTEEIEVIIMV